MGSMMIGKYINIFLGVVMGLIIPDAHAKENIIVGFGDSLAPYTLLHDEKVGLEVKIIQEALAYKKHTIKPVFFPLKSLGHMFSVNRINGIHRYVEGISKSKFYCQTKPTIIYQDVLVSLKKNHYSFVIPSDLYGKSLVTFPSASKHYPKWVGNKDKFSFYMEINKQINQLNMLFAGRVEVIMLDVNIFNYLKSVYQATHTEKMPEVDIHPFVEPYTYRAIFSDQTLCDDFDEGLRQLIKTGRLTALAKQAKIKWYINKPLEVILSQ